MPLDKVIVGIGGISAILFVAWFFFGKKVEEVTAGRQVQVIVDGGYSPEVIRVQKGQPVTLNFYRKDPGDCLEEVVLPEFGVRQYLPVNQVMPVEIKPEQPGEYTFSCGMNMFHGKIKVME